MKRTRFTDEQIIGILKEAEASRHPRSPQSKRQPNAVIARQRGAASHQSFEPPAIQTNESATATSMKYANGGGKCCA